MCGILGYSHGRKVLPAMLVESALRGIYHRGPDQQGTYRGRHMSLGAVRLSIVDLAHGAQPMYSPDRNVVIAYNGEIYNHGELRRELESEGHRFESQCDTEVVLKAFLHWGTAAFARLRGMFAVALWVESERRLVLARDRMGIKPLYYREQDGEIFFGSELKCILEHPDVPRHLSLAGLNCFLRLNYVPGPYTLLDGIWKLMPGHVLEWKDGQSEIHPYITEVSSVRRPKNIDEACEELDVLLRESVKDHLLSDVPVGIWLSGGLDSSTVLHYASEAGAANLRTFSVGFPGQSFDESDYVAEVVSHYGAQHSQFELNAEADLVGAIEKIAYYSDEPSADAGALPVWFLSEMTKRDVTVVLSGEGADEVFGGYLTYKADRYATMARLFPRPLRVAMLSAALLLPVSDEKIGFEYKLKRFLRGTLMDADEAHVFWNGTFTESEKRLLFSSADERPLKEVLRSGRGSGLQRYLGWDQRYYLPDDILYKLDRISMAHSLEARPPFLDPRLVDFAAALPASWKIRGTSSKYVLRRLMRDKLPRTILQRPKIGFDVPVHQWFRGALKPYLLDTLSCEAVQQTGVLNWKFVERMVDDHLARRANVGYHLWGLTVLVQWMKRWKVEPGPELMENLGGAEAMVDGSFCSVPV
jgi:asparagine synthase (glutamine-hydrolysing)